ncbi:transglycosylase SLT domain-containing protein [Acaricomes phytoseiuli]|uniref:transglycosylase SLT domain-containing protein n=1 Tax=Acaricomes phytoseiuli TaxID=291968 RepID=UPI0012EACC8F|nr:transglycosylase SLT domain-containing protein [Acaricomes phytoseiuli]
MAPVLGVIGLIVFIVAVVAGSPTSAACPVTISTTDGNDERSTVSIPNGWGPIVDKAAQESGIPASILAAQLNAESGWNPRAVSPVGAQGLAQFMPGTWAMYGKGDPFDPEAAITAQGVYMKALIEQVRPIADKTGTDIIRLALAAYNAGPGAVIAANGIPAFPETQSYVETIFGSGQSTYSQDCTVPGGSVIGELSGQWVDPLPGALVTSGYGPRSFDGFHYGVDLSTPIAAGTVLAPTDMKITVATDIDGGTGAGTHVKGQTTDGKLTIALYHMETGSLKVRTGDTVAAGTPLGTEGATGNVTGRHLHMEFFTTDKPNPWAPGDPTVDPLPAMRQKGARP